ncbi:hypothetical protein PUN28_010269 [Cardiocondyla obscurior]|uniref:Uncharacterized protein n=1 Tax=Cardiocondyla obscurior TaxID=286306 RepID=A0AAW2FR88_9HYME
MRVTDRRANVWWKWCCSGFIVRRERPRPRYPDQVGFSYPLLFRGISRTRAMEDNLKFPILVNETKGTTPISSPRSTRDTSHYSLFFLFFFFPAQYCINLRCISYTSKFARCTCIYESWCD